MAEVLDQSAYGAPLALWNRPLWVSQERRAPVSRIRLAQVHHLLIPHYRFAKWRPVRLGNLQHLAPTSHPSVQPGPISV
jgi:hypothetical protein